MVEDSGMSDVQKWELLSFADKQAALATYFGVSKEFFAENSVFTQERAIKAIEQELAIIPDDPSWAKDSEHLRWYRNRLQAGALVCVWRSGHSPMYASTRDLLEIVAQQSKDKQK